MGQHQLVFARVDRRRRLVRVRGRRRRASEARRQLPIAQATIACPDSCTAIRHSSSRVSRWLLRAGPERTRSIASSSSGCSISSLLGAHGQQRRLVDDVGEVGAGEAGRLMGDAHQVGVRGDRAAARVQREDLGAAVDVGHVDDDLPVEAPGPQQRAVENVGAVGRGHHHDAGLGAEAVHLDEHLVERLLALVVALAHAGAALAPDGVELVDEDDRRAPLRGPDGTGRAHGRRRRRRATRRTPSRRARRSWRRPRRRPRGRAASCRYRGARRAARPSARARPAWRSGRGSRGSRRSRAARPAPRARRRRRRT